MRFSWMTLLTTPLIVDTYFRAAHASRSDQYQSEQDNLDILDLVHFSDLVTFLVGKIPFGNVLFHSFFQNIHL